MNVWRIIEKRCQEPFWTLGKSAWGFRMLEGLAMWVAMMGGTAWASGFGLPNPMEFITEAGPPLLVMAVIVGLADAVVNRFVGEMDWGRSVAMGIVANLVTFLLIYMSLYMAVEFRISGRWGGIGLAALVVVGTPVFKSMALSTVSNTRLGWKALWLYLSTYVGWAAGLGVVLGMWR